MLLVPGSPELRARWALDPSVVFLNHGSFGATPIDILDAQNRLRTELEAEPVRFLGREMPTRVDDARRRVATFLGADADGLVPVYNATTGVNAVLHSIRWREGDEIVLADSTYNAVKMAARALSDRYGVRVVEARPHFPFTTCEGSAGAYAAALSERTRLVVVDHIVSATAQILPVREVVEVAHAAGVPVLVDGAHAPGMLPLSIAEVGADFYTGNLHKWLCTPKGAAVLWVAPEWRSRVEPTVTSHGYGQGFQIAFDWPGTLDPTAFLSAPAAIDWFEALGMDAVRAANHGLVQRGRQLLAEALDVELPHPDDPAFYGSMAVIPVPWARASDPGGPAALTARLYDQHRIEVPFTSFDDRVWVRISGQLYNRPQDYERLAEVLRTWRG